MREIDMCKRNYKIGKIGENTLNLLRMHEHIQVLKYILELRYASTSVPEPDKDKMMGEEYIVRAEYTPNTGCFGVGIVGR